MSNSQPMQAIPPFSSLDHIHLVEEGNEFLVVQDVSKAAGNPSFAPFKLPPVPKSQADWLAVLCQLFAVRHGRCMGALMFLDFVTQQWSVGIPKQRCAGDASCWQTGQQDFTGLPASHLIAGSFQRRIFSAGEQPADAVPPVDGVHLILCHQPETPTIWTFVCADRKIQRVRAERMIRDDMEETLDAVLQRVELI